MSSLGEIVESRPQAHRDMHTVTIREYRKKKNAARAPLRRNVGWTVDDWAAIHRECRKLRALQARRA